MQGELVPAPLALLQQQSFDEVIASPFVEFYLKRLIAAAQETVTQKGGKIILPRWKTEVYSFSYIDSLSYGYYPSEVAFALKQLLGLLTKTAHENSKTLLFTRGMLFGFSGVLGYYNLCRYLLQSPTDMEKKDVVWLQLLLDLSKSYIELESTMSDTGAKSWLAKHLPRQMGAQVGNEVVADIPCYFSCTGSSYSSVEDAIATAIFITEKKRLLDFRKSLYLFLAVLAPQDEREGSGNNPAVSVKEVTEENGSHYYRIQLSDDTRFTGSRSFIVSVPEDGEIELFEDGSDG